MTVKLSKSMLQWLVVAGCLTIKLPLGVGWYYGNLVSYMYSYFWFRLGPGAFDDVNGDWLLTTFTVSAALGIMSVDLVFRRVPMSFIQLGSIIVTNLGLFLTHFTVQYSVGMVLVTLMMVCGFAVGMASIVALKYIALVIPEKVGRYSAIASSGLAFGAMICGYIITAYINPDNYSPDFHVASNMVYFSQISLLDRVPNVFLILGLYTVGCHVIGYTVQQMALYWLSRLGQEEEETISINIVGSDLYGSRRNSAPEYTERDLTLSPEHSEDKSERNREKHALAAKHTDSDFTISPEHIEDTSVAHGKRLISGSIRAEPDLTISPTQIEDTSSQSGVNGNHQLEELESADWNLSPLQILRTKSFYVLWFAMAVLTYGQLLILNFYKLYGQLWIRDDIFLTSASSISGISACVCRMLFGSLVDAFGVRNVLISVFSINTVFSLLWMAAPQIDKWLYFICLQFLIGVQSTAYIMFPLCALKLFGPKFYASNYGLITTSNVAMSIASPFFYAFLQVHFGMLGMVLLSSIPSVVVIVTALVILPSTK